MRHNNFNCGTPGRDFCQCGCHGHDGHRGFMSSRKRIEAL